MSAPGNDQDRRRFLDAPRWMDGGVALFAATLCTVLGTIAGVAAFIWATLIAMGESPRSSIPEVVGLAVLSVLLFLVALGANRHSVVSVAPTDAPPGRLFQATLLARGGWLARYLAPDTRAYLVLADDHLRLRWRRPHIEVFLMNMVIFVLAGRIPGLQGRDMLWVHIGGAFALIAFQIWAANRLHDFRYPWDRVTSVSNWTDRFEIRVDDEEFRDGFLLRIPVADCASAIAVFKARAVFHDEAFAAVAS